MKKNCCLARILATTLAAPALAFSQAPEQRRSEPTTEGTDGETTLPEVVVTSKTEGSSFSPFVTTVGVLGERDILNVPFSVTRIDREMMDRRQVRNIGDITKFDAGIEELNSSASFNSFISIRGFEANTYLVDGLGGVQLSQPFMVESVDVFKGPSSAFFGAPATFAGFAGAINYNPKRPPLGDAVIRRFTLGWQSRNNWLGNLDLGDRFGSKNQFGYRLNVGGNIGEGVAEDYDPQEYYLGLSLEWQVNNAVRLTTDLGHVREYKQQYRDGLGLAPGVKLPPVPDLDENLAQPWMYLRNDYDYAFLHADIQLAQDWTLELGGGITRRDEPAKYGSGALIIAEDGTAEFGAGRTTLADPIDIVTTLAVLRGKFDTGPFKHSIALSYRYDSQNGLYQDYEFAGPFIGSIYERPSYPEPDWKKAETFQLDYQSQVAQFTDFIDLHPMVTLMGGGAYVHIKDGGSGFNDGVFTPIAGLIFKPWTTTSVYVGYSEGIEQGGRAPEGTANFGASMPPRVSTQVEVGIKHRWGKLDFTFAAFDLKRSLEYVNASNVYVQDGFQTHRGLEFSPGGDVTRDLSLLFSVAYLDTELGAEDPTVEGNRAVGVPEWALRLFAEYRLTDLLPGFAVNVGVIYTDQQYVFADNSETIPSYTLLDLGASYDLMPAHNIPAVVRFAVDNVVGTNYYAGAAYNIAFGDPRTFKVWVQYDF